MPIFIKTADVFGGVKYIHNRAGHWQAQLANGIPFCLHQAAHAKDQMALEIDLHAVRTPAQAIAVLRRHSTWEGAQFEDVSPQGEGEAERIAAEAPAMLAALQRVAAVMDMSDPESANFADSAADCLDALLNDCADVVRILQRLGLPLDGSGGTPSGEAVGPTGGPAGETCQHCGEDRPAGPPSSSWQCGNCGGLNHTP